jgi:hypothetical protein
MTLEQVLLKIYTDLQFRQGIQDGTEDLPDLTEQERSAITSMDFGSWNYSTPRDPETAGCIIRRV